MNVIYDLELNVFVLLYILFYIIYYYIRFEQMIIFTEKHYHT